MQALVVWTKESKTGIEPQSHIPTNARFAGAVTPVRFSGDKRWYPAKVIMLSASTTALEEKCKEVAEQLLKDNSDTNAKKELGKRKRRSGSSGGKASEQEVARALGSKVPAEPHLQEAKDATCTAKKTAKMHSLKGQEKTDRSILALGKGNQPQNSKVTTKEPSDDPAIRDYLETTDDELDGPNESNDGSEVEEEEIPIEKWCQCNPCEVLQKYDNAMFHNFLTDLLKLYSTKSSKCKKFLVLKPILPGCKQSELVPGSGIYIQSAVKDEIRVDFKNKPSSLIREILFALYGKEQLRVLPVTSRGIKPGSYGIQEDVLKALVDFVNKNVDGKKAVTFKSLTTTINKRAPEWRRGERSPKSPHKKKVMPSSHSLKVTATSPFKCTPLNKSPRFTPRRTPVNSASKPSPLKDRATDSPGLKRQLFTLNGPEAAAGQAAATPEHLPAAPAAAEPHAPTTFGWPGYNYGPPQHQRTAYEGYGGYGYQGYGGPQLPYQYNSYDQHYSSNITELH